jgi:hypothetical protein
MAATSLVKTGLALAIMLTLVVSLSVALWSETLRVNVEVDTGEVKVAFVDGDTSVNDPDISPCNGLDLCLDDAGEIVLQGGISTINFAGNMDKDIGNMTWNELDLDGDGYIDKIHVVINNAFPEYLAEVSYGVVNVGTIPVIITKYTLNISGNIVEFGDQDSGYIVYVDVNGDGFMDIAVQVTNMIGVQIDPGHQYGSRIRLLMLQPLPENSLIEFEVGIVAEQWNEATVIGTGSPITVTG